MKKDPDKSQTVAMVQSNQALDAYKAYSLEEDDPLQVCMHLVNATLMDALQLVHRSLESGAGSLDFESRLRAVETETKVVREIEKVSRFVTRNEADNMKLLRDYHK